MQFLLQNTVFLTFPKNSVLYISIIHKHIFENYVLKEGGQMIFVTGDCHGNFERFKPEYFPEQAQMTKQDSVICAGDFGGVWFGDSRDDVALDWLESLPFTMVTKMGLQVL